MKDADGSIAFAFSSTAGSGASKQAAGSSCLEHDPTQLSRASPSRKAGKGFRGEAGGGARYSRIVRRAKKAAGGGFGRRRKKNFCLGKKNIITEEERGDGSPGECSMPPQHRDTLRTTATSSAASSVLSRLSSAAASCGSRSRGGGGSKRNDDHGEAAPGEATSGGGCSGSGLVLAAIGAAASSRRSAVGGGRRSSDDVQNRRRGSAERAARAVKLSTRRSAIRRVSPGEEAIKAILAARELEEEAAEDYGGSDGGRRSSLLLRRRRSSSSSSSLRSLARTPKPAPSPFCVSLQSCKPDPPPPHRPECLGTIRYQEDTTLRAAREEALRTGGRPLFVVSFRRHSCCGALMPPLGGCCSKRCEEEEEEPLSHPLLVEAAETLFVPVLLEVKDTDENSKDSRDDDDDDNTGAEKSACCSSAADDACCESAGGATLRLMDPRAARGGAGTSSSSDLLFATHEGQGQGQGLPRRFWTVGSVARAMTQALRLAGGRVPPYLDLLVESEGGGGGNGCIPRSPQHGSPFFPSTHSRDAYLGTSDARRAEAELARLDGVSSTSAGWWISSESSSEDTDEHDRRIRSQRTVKVTYDPARLSFGMLLRYALTMDVVDEAVYVRAGTEEGTAARMELSLAAGGCGSSWSAVPRASAPPLWARRLRRSFVREYPTEHNDDTDGRSERTCHASAACFFRPSDAAERKSSLRSTPLNHVPLTGLQSARANLLVRNGKFHEAVRLLSPRQGMIFMKALKSRPRPPPSPPTSSRTTGGGGGGLASSSAVRAGVTGGAPAVAPSAVDGGTYLPDLTDVPLTEAWRRLIECGFFDE